MNRSKTLINELQDHSGFVQSRCEAARKLGIIGDPRVIGPLITALGDGEQELLTAVEEALDKINPDWRNSHEAKNQTSEFIACLIDNSETPSVRIYATYPLGTIGDPAVEPLIAVLGDDDKVVRAHAIVTLGNIGDPRAVEPLIAALSDDNEDVRTSAEEALQNMGSPHRA